MLTTNEREKLSSQNTLAPKERAKLHYHIANKIKANLSDLDDINYALCSIPTKNARRTLSDEVVISLFKLTENILRILGYVPVREDANHENYVIRMKPKLIPQNNRSLEYKTIIEAPDKMDVARKLLIEKHLENLRPFWDPSINSLILGMHEGISPFSDGGRARSDGYNLFKEWQHKLSDKPD